MRRLQLARSRTLTDAFRAGKSIDAPLSPRIQRMTSALRPVLAIVCPVHNEEAVIPLFFDRLSPIMAALAARYCCRLIFLNNASTDRTRERIEIVREKWPETYVITMSRNVGYQASLDYGLRSISADLFVVIDADCEDPPEMIAQFIEQHEQGFDIVYGERVDRPEPPLIKSGRKLFYRLLQKLADEEIILDMAEFSLFTGEVRDAIIDDRSSFPFIRASIGRIGFRRTAIPFTRQRRIAGVTHYNILGMSIFAIAGILSSSTLLLRLPVYILPFWILTLSVLGAWSVAAHSAWIGLAALIVFASYVGATIAFTALYVARGYKNGLQRPNAVMDRKRSHPPPPPAETR
jgi:polyisoprenyl-phosphate glycosyltransferase